MPLEEYQRKRDFAKTPEPAGATSWPRDAGHGSVRRPAPSRDPAPLRLPPRDRRRPRRRGPSRRARRSTRAIRRMAVHVEDHPIEYFDFEGVIPKGEYGAGDVIVWDWGTWTPEAETPDPAQAIEDGELKFASTARSSSGRFTIVRTSGRRPGSARRRRAFEDDERRAVAAHPQARRRRGRRAGTPRTTRRASRPAARTTRSRPTATRSGSARRRRPSPRSTCGAANDAQMPAFIEPMAATLADQGVQRRRLAVRDQVGRLSGRGGRPRRHGEALHPERQGRRDVLPEAAHAGDLDRRAARRSSTARSSRSTRTAGPTSRCSRSGSARPGGAVRTPASSTRPSTCSTSTAGRCSSVPLEDRKRLLQLGPPRDDRRVRFATTSTARAWRSSRRREAQGLEGDRRQAPPLALRARAGAPALAEAQDPAGAGARRRRLDAGRGQREGPRRASSSAYYEGDGKRSCASPGKVGSGFNAATRQAAPRSASSRLAIDDSPFDPPPPKDYKGRWGGDLKNVIWVKPELVIRAELGGWTRDGIVRQAAFKGFDEGGKPADRGRPRGAGRAGRRVEAVEAAVECRELARMRAGDGVEAPRTIGRGPRRPPQAGA